jgi:outer membrane protein
MLTLRNLSLITILFVSYVVSPSQAQTNGPKIATIDIAKILKEYYIVEKARDEVVAMQKALEETRITKRYKETQEKHDAAVETYRELLKKDETPEVIENFRLELLGIRGDYQSISREWKEWRRVEQRKLNKELATRERLNRNNIGAAAAKIGDEMGFDFVIDMIGSTSSQLPAVLYLRNGTDITEEVIKELNKSAPPEDLAPDKPTEVAEPKN